MIKCSIGICVYNEAGNVGNVLSGLLQQKLKKVVIDEILIIESGSTDNSTKIVKKYGKIYKRIKIIRQTRRLGKASAVNLFIQKAKNEILALVSGDLILTENVVETLVNKFHDPEVGMTGAHPIPVNTIDKGFMNFAGNLLWELHHRVALKRPKMGEMIAFRKIFRRIPTFTGADEASIEPLILGQGYMIKYVPKAKIYNKAPTNLKEFIEQRRRNYWLHLIVKHKQHYLVSTLDTRLILYALFSLLKEHPGRRYLLFTPFVALIEAYSRFLGWWDYKIEKRKHSVWKSLETTKYLGKPI